MKLIRRLLNIDEPQDPEKTKQEEEKREQLQEVRVRLRVIQEQLDTLDRRKKERTH